MRYLLALLLVLVAAPAMAGPFSWTSSSATTTSGSAIVDTSPQMGVLAAGGATAPSYGWGLMGVYQSSPATVTNGYASPVLLNSTAAIVTDPKPTAITPVVSSSAGDSLVLKASAGSLVGLTVTTGASAGYLMVHNATSKPADGAVTPLACVVVPANQTVAIDYSGAPLAFSTGITAEFSTTGCFTATASATAFFSGQVR